MLVFDSQNTDDRANNNALIACNEHNLNYVINLYQMHMDIWRMATKNPAILLLLVFFLLTPSRKVIYSHEISFFLWYEKSEMFLLYYSYNSRWKSAGSIYLFYCIFRVNIFVFYILWKIFWQEPLNHWKPHLIFVMF